MSHKVLINGTAYDATGGTPLISGTKFQVGGGKTLINGTARTIKFKADPVTVELSGAMRDTLAMATYDGTDYTAAATLTVEDGKPVVIEVGSTRGDYGKCTVTLNGTVVFTGDRQKYSYYPKSNATVVFESRNYWVSGRMGFYYIATITEG